MNPITATFLRGALALVLAALIALAGITGDASAEIKGRVEPAVQAPAAAR